MKGIEFGEELEAEDSFVAIGIVDGSGEDVSTDMTSGTDVNTLGLKGWEMTTLYSEGIQKQ